MQIVPTVRWKNCRKQITRVLLEVRSISPNGGLADAAVQEFFPNVTAFPNGREKKSFRRYLLDANDQEPNEVGFVSVQETAVLKSCTQRADGNVPPDIEGTTFYAVATAYNSTGKQLRKAVSKVVACGQ